MRKETIVITEKIESTEIQNQIWEIYKKSFTGTEITCVQNQKCYNHASFMDALTDQDYYKYYMMIDGKVVAYMLSTANLQKASITYMNPERYQALFPNYTPHRINYCTSLAVLPEYKDSNIFFEIMSEFLNHIFNSLDGILAFDFSHETMEKLPKVLKLIWKRSGQSQKLKYTKVGAQEFGALVPDKPSDQKNTTE